MAQHLRTKVLAIVAILVVFGSIGVYPIIAAHYGIHSPGWLMSKKLKLGLDLQGGVHLVLQVRTEDALRLETEGAVERLREALKKGHIAFVNLAATSPVQFKVTGVPPEQAARFRQASAEIETTFARSAEAAGANVFTMKSNVQADLREEAVVQARATIERRVNELGVTEPSLARQGSQGDEILVELPGVADIEHAKQIIQSPGLLELKLVEGGPATSRDALLINGQVPDGMEILPGAADANTEPIQYLVRRAAAVTGHDVRSARTTADETNLPAVGFTLTVEGGRKFAKVTGEHIGRPLAIVLNGRVQSAPSIDNIITTDGVIHGRFTPSEAQDLAIVLRSGALYTSIIYLEQQAIGPSLGRDSIRAGIISSVLGLLLIVAFMLIFYKASGTNVVVALLLNLIILLGLLAYIGAVMTLPGIAGFVLTMGIGVDSNVLIFERIKEELERGQGVRASIKAGFGRVLLTLMDTHLTALISAAFLFQFGTGPIRGFAVTLSLGLISNLFTSTFVSKTLFELVLANRGQTKRLSI